MISRTWRGWTTLDNADTYEELRNTIFPGILARDIPGFDAIELGRRVLGEEVEFLTIMWFRSWDAVKLFAGPDWEISVVPTAARNLLTRFDETAQHYEVQERRRRLKTDLEMSLNPQRAAVGPAGPRKQ